RCGAGTKFYRRFCRNSDRFNIEIQLFVGKVMIESVLLNSFAFTLNYTELMLIDSLSQHL
ncbi:hypothetical protein, partial [Leptospira interrogans]|uniref:hypothetical protein n=1 Tax=Leptospira interrogans TaxID=173 RepID=UPI0039F199B5